MQFSVHASNRVWVSDVTYFKLDSKFQYICAIIDLYARKVVAYKISPEHSSQLITATFKLAYSSRKPEAGLIFHSDRGAQYTSHAFQNLLKSYNNERPHGTLDYKSPNTHERLFYDKQSKQ